MRWKTINRQSDLDLLPRNSHNKQFSKYILVSSNKRWALHDIYLMYYDFDDCVFHFPKYSVGWKSVKLTPISEINKWLPLPKKPKMKADVI